MGRRRSTAQMLSGWPNAVEDAVRSLAEDPRCDHDFYLSLLEVNAARGGRTVIVEREQQPMAVIGLQPDGVLRWRNALNWLVPGFILAADGDALDAVESVPGEVYIAWWRRPERPSHPSIRALHETTVHALNVADRHAFWGQGSHARSIRRARAKCAHLDLHFDEAGASEWVVRSSARKWGGAGGDTSPAAGLSVEAARQLQSRGRQMTVTIHDGDRRLAGQNCTLDGDTLIMTTTYRDDSVGTLPTGIRLMEEVSEYAEREGIARVDIGGGYAYKTQWAPPAGSRFDIIMAPALLYRSREMGSRFASSIRALRRRTQTRSTDGEER